MGDVLAAKKRLEEVYAAYARARRRLRRARRRAGRARSASSPPPAARTPTSSSRSPPTRCACRRGTPRSACSRAAKSAASRCAACCCPSPTCCCSTSRPTTWTPNRSTGWSSSCSASRAPWSPSPTIATSSTTPPSGSSNSTAARGIPWKGNYSDLARAEGSDRLEQEQKTEDARAKAMKKELEWVRQNPKGAPGQEQGAPGPLRGTERRRIPEAQRDATKSSSRWPSGWAMR